MASEPGATGASVLEALGVVVYREHGPVVLSIAFEALAWGEHGSAWAEAGGFRARFEALEEITVQAKRLADLPAPPPRLAH